MFTESAVATPIYVSDLADTRLPYQPKNFWQQLLQRHLHEPEEEMLLPKEIAACDAATD